MTIVKCPKCNKTIGCQSRGGWWEELCVNCIEGKTNTCSVKDVFDTVNVVCKECKEKDGFTPTNEMEKFWSSRWKNQVIANKKDLTRKLKESLKR